MFERHRRRSAADRREQPAEDRAEERAEREVEEVDDAGGGPAQLGRVGFLDHGVRQHRRAAREAGDETEDVGREHARRPVQNPRQARQQDDGAADNHGLTTAQAIGHEPQERTADDPAERHRCGSHHRGAVLEAAGFLEITDAPDHVEDRRRDEQQARDHSAQDRLRIAEHDDERAHRITQPVLAANGRRLRRQHQEQDER